MQYDSLKRGNAILENGLITGLNGLFGELASKRPGGEYFPDHIDINDQSAMLRFLVSEINRNKIEAEREEGSGRMRVDGPSPGGARAGGAHTCTKVQCIKVKANGGGASGKGAHWMQAEHIDDA